ncbi:hypothetical protein [Agrobacterium tumefaciens]|uniref:hypothetical protein n=1 Tax=Agrobacterium tumefaciens TaxID=358 RepID=UPI0012DAE893|nr:hypothetical protein [Agrobacterium tumefaciens]
MAYLTRPIFAELRDADARDGSGIIYYDQSVVFPFEERPGYVEKVFPAIFAHDLCQYRRNIWPCLHNLFTGKAA